MKTTAVDKWLDLAHSTIDETVWSCFTTIYYLSKDISSIEISRSIREALVIEMLDDISKIQDTDLLDVLIEADKIFESDLLISLMKVSEFDSKQLYFELSQKHVMCKIFDFIVKKTS